MSNSRAGWYARRLRAMGPDEAVWRARDAVTQRVWSARRGDSIHTRGRPRGMTSKPTFASPLPDGARAAVPDDAAGDLVACAESILAGDWDVLGEPRGDIAMPDWFFDQVTGVHAPSSDPPYRINHRDETKVGNIKSLWEVSRHHHLAVLAAAWWVTRDEKYATVVDRQLRSWWAQNPFMSGVHWTSGIELGLRLINWTWIRRLMDAWPGVVSLFEDNADAGWQLWWHQRHLARFRSRGSSANNHVIAEAAGLVVASHAFPWFAESATWQAGSRELLEREFRLNTFPSGINRELASEYHGFVTELVLTAAVEAAAAGLPVSADTWQLIGDSLDAAAALLDVTGRPPRQGDGDDGRVLVVDHPERLGWPQLLTVGGELLGRADWWPAPAPSVASAVLPGLFGRVVPVTHVAERPDRFDDAGITLLRTPQGHHPELWCRCDGGPHGFLAIAAHAHADALSLELRHEGVDIFADPGTYCYHGEPEWRSYFRSTIGHNTLEIGGADQSESGGPFLWVCHANARALPAAEPRVLTWCAEHDGYMRGAEPAMHRRTVSLDVDGRTLTIDDLIEAPGPVQARLAWHLGPDVDVALNGESALLGWSKAGTERSASVGLPAQLAWTAHRGESHPVLGWYSSSFGRRQPTTTLLGEARLGGSTTLRTVVRFQ